MSLFVNLLLYSRSYYCLTPSLLDDFFDQVHKTVLWKKGGMRRRSSERLCSRKQQTNATAIVLRWPGSPDSSLVECRTHDSKVASLNPGRSGGRIFFSRVKFVFWLVFGVRSIPVIPQWHVKKPCHSSKSTGGRLHLNTHARLTKRSRYAAVRT